MLNTQNRGISPENRGCPFGTARGLLLIVLRSRAISSTSLFQRTSYVREGIALWGNRARGETYVDFASGKILKKLCCAGSDRVVGLDLRKG